MPEGNLQSLPGTGGIRSSLMPGPWTSGLQNETNAHPQNIRQDQQEPLTSNYIPQMLGDAGRPWSVPGGLCRASLSSSLGTRRESQVPRVFHGELSDLHLLNPQVK
jgi:hypothetical protein